MSGSLFYVGSMILTLLFANPAGADNAGQLLFGAIAGVVIAAGLLYGIRVGLGKLSQQIFQNYYREASRWLYHTNLLAVFIDENQTAQILELVDSTPGLRWMSPSKPRKLEDMLEFAACYFAGYKKLLYGPGRLDPGSVFLGSLAWYAGQRQCVMLGCCCCLFPYSTMFTLPCWIFAGIGYINRLAVEACCIDYLLDEPRDSTAATQPLAPARSHGVGGPAS
jgi:hypothetical protein